MLTGQSKRRIPTSAFTEKGFSVIIMFYTALITVTEREQESGKDLTILGSGSIISQLLSARLTDEYQIIVTPVV